MNAERLHSVIKALDSEIVELKIAQLLQNLLTTLNNSLSQRTPPASQAFEDANKALIAALEQCPSNHYVPSWHSILMDIGGEDYTGRGLALRVGGTIAGSSLTPGKAVEEIQKIITDANSFYSTVKGLMAHLVKVNIPTDELPDGDCEIGVLLPVGVIDSELSRLRDEIRDLDRHLKAFSEIVDEKVGIVKIRSLGTGSLQVFLLSSPIVAAAVATAIERIVALYKKVLEIRLLQKQLEDHAVPKEKVIDPLIKHEKEMVAQELDALAIEIIKEYKGKDVGRKNELKTSLSLALRYLADRIDKGVDFEVRAADAAPEEKAVESQESEAKANEGATRALSTIRDKGAALRAIERVGEGVLSLSHMAEEEKSHKSKT